MTIDQGVHGHGEALARMLQLDAVVHERYLFEITTWLRGLASGTRVRRLLDVGTGTGSGAFALAQRFTDAEVVAIDISETMLERVRNLAFFSGLAQRVSTRQADIGGDVQSLGTFDLIWASASLHEVEDADGAFRNLFRLLRPGGILAVAEMDGPSRFLPDQYAEFEERLHSTPANGNAHEHGGSEGSRGGQVDHPDWSDAIAGAGFELMNTRTFSIDQPGDGAGPAGEYAQLYLQRIADSTLPQLSAVDAAALAILLGSGPEGVRTRADLRIRDTRTVWIARRPG